MDRMILELFFFWGGAGMLWLGYGLDDPGSIPGRGKRFFSSPKQSDQLWDPATLLLSGYPGVLSEKVKWPAHVADHSFSFTSSWCGQGSIFALHTITVTPSYLTKCTMHLLAGLSRHFYHHVTPRTPHVRLYQKPANNVLCERSKVGQTVRMRFVCGLCQSCSIKNRRKRIVSCKCFRSQEVLAQQGPKKRELFCVKQQAMDKVQQASNLSCNPGKRSR
jgi:hypothetical protein